MKTIEQVLQGVRAKGKWESTGNRILWRADFPTLIGSVERAADGDFIVRACSTWPELVKTLEALVKFSQELCEDVNVSIHQPSIEYAKAALAVALKD